MQNSEVGQNLGLAQSRREKPILEGTAREEHLKTNEPDPYILANLEISQQHLYVYLLDYTKDQARAEVLSGKETGVFETYPSMVPKGLNIFRRTKTRCGSQGIKSATRKH